MERRRLFTVGLYILRVPGLLCRHCRYLHPELCQPAHAVWGRSDKGHCQGRRHCTRTAWWHGWDRAVRQNVMELKGKQRVLFRNAEFLPITRSYCILYNVALWSGNFANDSGNFANDEVNFEGIQWQLRLWRTFSRDYNGCTPVRNGRYFCEFKVWPVFCPFAIVGNTVPYLTAI